MRKILHFLMGIVNRSPDVDRDALLAEYCDLKAEMRIRDAQSCTSFKQEFAQIYRDGLRPASMMCDEELREVIAEMKNNDV